MAELKTKPTKANVEKFLNSLKMKRDVKTPLRS